MKLSQSLIAAAVIAVLPLSALAGDKDKAPAPMGSVASAEFNTLDTNGDKRISRMEASRDSKLVFASADKNADGYIDSSEFAQRDVSDSSMPSPGRPDSDPAQPRQ
jgi:hypothetical protein